MDIFHEWISHLIIFLLAAFLLELLLPSSSFQKYARLVLSFILMLLIIEPLMSFTSIDAEQELKEAMEEWRSESFPQLSMEGEINQQKNEIESGQDAYISKQVSRQLQQESQEEIRSKWGWEVESISAESMDNNKTASFSVDVTLRKAEEGKKDNSVVDPVHIDVDKEDRSQKNSSGDTDQIRAYLSETWGIPKEQVEISIVEEGESAG
ncbi:stage III sporulation protein AF [Salibacterium halotolerans]|uniref:Stage III sporulation protein AF n=1 Tax=Salibacterium halotolerans TaxID=1884432 RepID=A0A1I5NN57_9BACI|nr:stage III sporulation protein AF [Salibacterium halotolerans]SFP23239.1 stage III sporulation protein AF [Salibacterium halotolerans]